MPTGRPVEINASDDKLSCVVMRGGQEAVVLNLELSNVEQNPQEVQLVDDPHPVPRG